MSIYDELLKAMPREELERTIDQKISEFNGLLTREIATKIIAKEKGILKEEQTKFVRLDSIQPGAKNITFHATVLRVFPVVIYPSGNRMRRILLKDGNAERSMRIWNEDIDLLKNLHVGDGVRVVNAIEKNGELSLGYRGSIEIVKEVEIQRLSDLKEGKVHLKANVESIDGFQEYEKDGEKRKMFVFYVGDGERKVRVVIWRDVERGSRLSEGDEIIIENADYRKGELHLNAASRLFLKKKRKLIKGILEKIVVAGGKLLLTIDGMEYIFERQDALKIFGVTVADDILLETLLEAKQGQLLNRRVVIRYNEENAIEDVRFSD